MSGIEIGIAVVSAVAALIAAYKDGQKIADRIKKKRLAKEGALPPSKELEKALHDGEVDITRLKDEGKYVKVDTEAAMALKDLIIEVQSTLLHQLAEAEQDDDFTDFSATIQTAVRTRRKAINVLNDLYQRTEEQVQKDKVKEEQQSPITEATPPPTPLSRAETVKDENAERSKLKFWRRPTNESLKEKTSKEAKRQSKESTQGNDRLAADDKRRSNSSKSPSLAPISPTISRSIPPTSPNRIRHSTAAFSDITRRSTFSIISPPDSPLQINPLSKTNDFGGFCKGAWHAQNLNLAKSVGKPSLRSWGWAFHCTKCSYYLSADMRDRNHPRFDDRVYKMEDTKFRLLFLLKSHMPQKSSKEKRTYGCLLCALAGGQKKCIGEEHLIEHVQHHALQTFGPTLLAGPVSIGSDNVQVESMSTYDIVFDGGEDFVLPPSALASSPTFELDSEPLDLVHEMYSNVWADSQS